MNAHPLGSVCISRGANGLPYCTSTFGTNRSARSLILPASTWPIRSLLGHGQVSSRYRYLSLAISCRIDRGMRLFGLLGVIRVSCSRDAVPPQRQDGDVIATFTADHMLDEPFHELPERIFAVQGEEREEALEARLQTTFAVRHQAVGEPKNDVAGAQRHRPATARFCEAQRCSTDTGIDQPHLPLGRNPCQWQVSGVTDGSVSC